MIISFADDMTLIGLTANEDETIYRDRNEQQNNLKPKNDLFSTNISGYTKASVFCYVSGNII